MRYKVLFHMREIVKLANLSIDPDVAEAVVEATSGGAAVLAAISKYPAVDVFTARVEPTDEPLGFRWLIDVRPEHADPTQPVRV